MTIKLIDHIQNYLRNITLIILCYHISNHPNYYIHLIYNCVTWDISCSHFLSEKRESVSGVGHIGQLSSKKWNNWPKYILCNFIFLIFLFNIRHIGEYDQKKMSGGQLLEIWLLNNHLLDTFGRKSTARHKIYQLLESS